ncbi:MAG: TolC family protein [Flavipsychrobacter sp.]|nr:TolC family protein [Flavipsychrobacter sp.]
MRFIIVLIIILLPAAGVGQVYIHDLGGLLRYADENSATARQAQLQPEISRQDVKLQSSLLYPRVNVFGSGDYNPLIPVMVIPAEVLGGAPGTYMKAQFGLPYIFQAGAELSIPVVDLEKWAQLQRARAQYVQSQWSSKAALEQFHLQLMQVYYQVLVTREVAALNDENMETVTELVRIMEDRKSAGILDPADYNRSVNLKLSTEAARVDYQKSIQAGMHSLRSLLSVAVREEITLTDKLSTFGWPVPGGVQDITSRPAWQEAELKVKVSQLALAESKRGGLPKLNLNSRYAYNLQSKFESGTNNVEFETATIGLRLDIPVFRGNYYRSLQKRNSLQLQSVMLEKDRTAASLNQQHADWQNQYKAAYLKHTVSEEKMNTASDNLRIARLNVKEGVMEFDEFNNIFIEYNRAKMEYLQNLADGVLYYLLSTQKF